MLWVSHLGYNGEEGWRSGESEDDGCYGGHYFREVGMCYDLGVGDEYSSWGCCGWTVLDAYGDCEGQNCEVLAGCLKLLEYRRCLVED
jgi:hypothetical protein